MQAMTDRQARAPTQRHPWRAWACTSLLLIALLQSLGWWPAQGSDWLDAKLADLRLRLSLQHTPDPRVVIVDVDEASLQQVGRWPWSRATLAQLVRELTGRQQVAALGLDVVFAEPQAQARSPGVGPASALAPDDDLAQALAGAPVVLGYYFTSDRDGRRSGQLPAPLAGQAPWPQLMHWSGYGANLAPLTQSAVAGGFFNAITDPDGIVRAVPLVAGFDGALYESMGLAMLRLGLGGAALRLTPGDADTRTLALQGPAGALTLGLDPRGTVPVPYRGAGGPQGGSFRYVSAVDVLAGKLPAGSLRGRYVLLGFTAPGLMDLRATPVGETYPGVEVHASLIAGALEGRLVHRPPWADTYELAVLLLLGALYIAVLPRLGLGGALALGGGAVLALRALDAVLYHNAHLLLPLAGPLLLTAATLVVDLALGFGVERRARRRLARQFSSYVPPELVRQMQRDPKRYDMQARTQELTVMFCDLNSFTSLAETLPPAELQALLHAVLERLSSVIARHQGTIDKYMGDCVMAFWGAPVANAQHARQAVEAALDIRAAMQAFNAERAAAGHGALAVGIGLNTGPVAVGNMGTALRRAYTVIGDAVNLASRLEGLAAGYGVDAVASQATMEQAGVHAFAWQELDRVRVRGRQQAEQIYTVRAPADAANAALQAELALWQLALAQWRGRQFEACRQSLQTLVERHPEQALYRLYAQRVAQLLQRGPASDWDDLTVYERK